jgi:hypothetical protein
VDRTGRESSTAKAPTVATLAGLRPERRFLGRNLSKADVSIFEFGGGRVAVKDYGARPFLVRQTFGRWMVRRETTAYRAADGAAGIAPYLGRVGPFAFATVCLDAMPLAEVPEGTVGAETFDRLDRILAELHARGVAIADLHHRDVLIGAGGDVHVVDFAAAYVLGANPSGFRRRVFARLAAQDRLAAARMRARFTGRREDEALAQVDPVAVRLWGVGRKIKALWDRLRLRRA